MHQLNQSAKVSERTRVQCMLYAYRKSSFNTIHKIHFYRNQSCWILYTVSK